MPEELAPEKLEAAKYIVSQMHDVLSAIPPQTFPNDDIEELAKHIGKRHIDTIFKKLLPQLIDLLGFKNGTFQLYAILETPQEYGIDPLIADFFVVKLGELIDAYDPEGKNPKTYLN